MRWDIFCHIIDNYGDAGVCWRLADALVRRHGDSVRLWVDQPAVLQLLAPGQTQVQVRAWQPQGGALLQADDAQPLPDAVVEAFGCTLPEEYQALIAKSRAAIAWINLEYLSAEPYVRRSHGLPSPVMSGPARGATKWFFYPGFEPGTGGLLWGDLPPPTPPEPKALVFSYDNPGWPQACEALLAAGLQPQLAAGPAAAELAWRAPHLAGRVQPLPFLPQRQFDTVLQASRIALVRGEDSFVRAQLAGRPLVWHIYPQHDGAHQAKLRAFYDRYAEGLESPAADALWALWQAWNARGAVLGDWQRLLVHLPALERHALAWRERLLALGDLTAELRAFALSKLK